MKSRHRARECALQILYRYDVAAQATGIEPPTGAALAEDLSKHFDHFQIAEPQREFAAALVVGTLSQREVLDEQIEAHATHWKVSRMGVVDRNLLRMGLYELKNFPDIPALVTLDEAIELAKQFGTSESPAFVNAILDSSRLNLPKDPIQD
jgi:N utilization substance protein B